MLLEYKKTFREHEGARASESATDTLKRIYNCSLGCTYNCCIYLCGFILACIWGVINGVIAFLQT
jgi:hypothetical protein